MPPALTRAVTVQPYVRPGWSGGPTVRSVSTVWTSSMISVVPASKIITRYSTASGRASQARWGVVPTSSPVAGSVRASSRARYTATSERESPSRTGVTGAVFAAPSGQAATRRNSPSGTLSRANRPSASATAVASTSLSSLNTSTRASATGVAPHATRPVRAGSGVGVAGTHPASPTTRMRGSGARARRTLRRSLHHPNRSPRMCILCPSRMVPPRRSLPQGRARSRCAGRCPRTTGEYRARAAQARPPSWVVRRVVAKQQDATHSRWVAPGEWGSGPHGR